MFAPSHLLLHLLLLGGGISAAAALSVPAEPAVDRRADTFASQLAGAVSTIAGSVPTANAQPVLTAIQSNAQAINSAAGSAGATKTARHTRQATDPRVAVACAVFHFLFPSEYTDQQTNSAAYTADQDENWAVTCWLPAGCFIKPQNTFEVAVQLKVLTLLDAKFSIRSGGHNPNPNFGSVDGSGVLLDLSGLSTVTVSDDASTVSAGAGAHWEAVYTALDARGVFATGTRYTGVGISGSTQGCNIPIIPDLAGLGCDNVQNFEVVLGDSLVVNANANENADLWQALKGSGNNLGIVTRVDLLTIPLHDLWVKTLTFNGTQYQQVLPALAQTQNNMESDNNAGIIFSAVGPTFGVTFLYAGTPGSTPAVFQPLDSLTPVAPGQVQQTTALAFHNSENVEANAPRNRFAVAGTSTRVDANLYLEVYQQYLAVAPGLAASQNIELGMAIQQFGSAAVDAGNARGGDGLGLTRVAQTWWSLLALWPSDDKTEAARSALLGFNSFIANTAQQAGLALPFLLPTTSDYTQDVMASYGAAGLAERKAASQKYDPGQVFQRQQAGGWFVSQA